MKDFEMCVNPNESNKEVVADLASVTVVPRGSRRRACDKNAFQRKN